MIADLIVLGMALFLFVSCVILVRPANGTRPLLVGIMISAAYAVYIASVRVLDLYETMRPFSGVALGIWIAVLLWALWAAALRTNRPVRYALRRLFGYNPDLD